MSAYSDAIFADSTTLLEARFSEAQGATVADDAKDFKDGTYVLPASLTMAVAPLVVGGDGAFSVNSGATAAYVTWGTGSGGAVGSQLLQRTNGAIGFWFKRSVTGVLAQLYGELGAGSAYNGSLAIGLNGTKVRAIYRDSATPNSAAATNGADGAKTVTDGLAHFAVLEKEGSTLRIYVDGVLDSTTTIGGTGSLGTGAGIYSRLGQGCTVTTFDELSLHSDILGPSKITALYNAGAGIVASAPANLAAPVVTGTAAVGQVLSGTNGNWSGSPTSYADQWQFSADGGSTWSDLTGSTLLNRTVLSSDAGHKLRLKVTATNSVGASAPAYSNVVTIPPAPVNTVLPSITTDGTPASGEVVTLNAGAFTNADLGATSQLYRGSSPVTGVTFTGASATYTLAPSDEGASLRLASVGHGSGGDSAVVFSDPPVVPAVTAPIGSESGLYYYSGGAGNTDPGSSVGGARGGTVPQATDGTFTLGNLFPAIPGSAAQAGVTRYALVYPRNTHATAKAVGGKVYVPDQLDHPGMSIAVGVPTQPAGTDVPQLASATTAPDGVAFTDTNDPDAGAGFGDLAPGQQRGLYVRLTVAPGTTQTPEDDTRAFRVRVRFAASA